MDVRSLTKRYGRRTVVSALDLRLPAGSVTGLIGPNGAGKTTVMAILLGLVRPTAGDGWVLGRPLADPTGYVRRVGAVIEGPAFHPALSGRANLTYLALLGGHDRGRVCDVLGLVGLSDRAGGRVGAYSLGMRQRLAIGSALLNDPDLVILDEPANGLDPVGMRDLRRVIRRIAREGRTVLVSSHLLAELEQVCDHLVVIDRGGLAHQGPPASLPRSGGERVELVALRTADVEAVRAVLVGLGRQPTVADGRVQVCVGAEDPRRLAAELNRAVVMAGLPLAGVGLRQVDLESRYLELVGAAGGPTGETGAVIGGVR